MGQRRRAPVIRLVLVFLLSLPLQPGFSQALLLPPLPSQEFSTAQGLLPQVSPWMEFRHFPAESGGTFHSHVLDFGSTITIYALGPFSLDGMVRQILLTRLHPESEWLFWLAALYTDLRLAIHAAAGPLDFALAYRHDCKHDIELFLGRDAAHDTIALTIGVPRLQWTWLAADMESRLTAVADAAWNIPLVYQYVAPEPDRFTLSADLDWEPLRVPGWPVAFVAGGLAVIGRGRDTRVTVLSILALDWHVRAGVRLAGKEAGAGTLAAYGQLQSLSDDWMSLEPVPATMFSFGLLIAF
jgi:hypothetical protein